MRREASRVSFLMCPFCVRVLMPLEARAFIAVLSAAGTPGCKPPVGCQLQDGQVVEIPARLADSRCSH
jgi:hypothetical protein